LARRFCAPNWIAYARLEQDQTMPRAPEAAGRKLLEFANAIEADQAGRLSVEIINRQFRDAGGSYEEYGAAVKAAVAHGWITMHPSGAYLSFTQGGA
jgi:hypothetical protein